MFSLGKKTLIKVVTYCNYIKRNNSLRSSSTIWIDSFGIIRNCRCIKGVSSFTWFINSQLFITGIVSTVIIRHFHFFFSSDPHELFTVSILEFLKMTKTKPLTLLVLIYKSWFQKNNSLIKSRNTSMFFLFEKKVYLYWYKNTNTGFLITLSFVTLCLRVQS